MDVSIIIPVYNAEKTLGKLLDSIIKNQTKVKYEILLINDGSIDTSLDVCMKYEKSYKFVKVINQKNAGPSSARNKGLESARGDFILFCDSDDYVSGNMLNDLFEYEKADLMIYGIVDEVWNSEAIISEKHHQPDEKRYEKGTDFLKDFYYLVENNLLYSQCTKMYRRSIIEENQIRFCEDLSMGEDVLFNLLYFSYVQTVQIIPLEFYHYVHLVDSNSITNGYYPRYYENVCMVLEKQKNLLEEKKVLTKENIISLESFFIGRISSAIQNELLNKENNLWKKYESVKKIICSEKAVEAQKIGKPQSFLHRGLSFGIRFKMGIFVFILYGMVYAMKNWIIPLKRR